jgi:transportin-3
LKTVFDALSADEPFESAVECLCTIFRETRDVDECKNIIQALYPNVVGLRQKLRDAASEEDLEVFKGISRIFSEAGEAWVVLIAREPEAFRALVEAILEIAVLDKDRDVISFTFNFWYELKQLIVLEIYMQARLVFADIYSKLVDIMIGHLEFPRPEDGDETTDLFEGDREQEEKFREFRHKMGDVLKDCCEVIGVTECLKKSYDLIEAWVQQHGQQAAAGQVPQWQKLEAPLFSMRAMGRMVSTEENIMLPRLIPLIVGIPDHEKVRFQAVMTLGRYTEWTSEHPDLLKPQLDFIMAAFQHSSAEVVRAAALSFKFFCNDCANLLKEYVAPIQQFYVSVLNKLPPSSQEEITDGVASVLARLPASQTYPNIKAFCDPIMSDIMNKAQSASTKEDEELVAGKSAFGKRNDTNSDCNQTKFN